MLIFFFGVLLSDVKLTSQAFYELLDYKNLLVNVNFPDLPESKIAGIKITRLGKRGIPDIPDLIRKNESSSFYSFGPSGTLMPDQVNTDMQAIKDNYISISILDYNLTATDSDWQIFETAFTDA